MQRINLFDPAVRDNPFPTYAQMRTESPVAMLDPGGMFALTRHADVVAAFRDTQTYSSEGFRAVFAPPWLGSNPTAESMLLMDPPAHTQNRALVSRAFIKPVMQQLERVIEEITNERLSAANIVAGEEFDVVAELAMPLAGGVITHALALPRELAPRMQTWTSAISKVTPVPPEPEVIAEIKASIAEQAEYLGAVVDARMNEPGDDLPSALCRAEIDGQRLSRDALIGFMFLLVGAGFETTIHLISKSAKLLAERPDVHDALREDPSKVGAFVEEMLRFDGPTHVLMRLTTRDVELHGVQIPAHSGVALVIGAANHDPDQFEAPERFDLDRQTKGALAFGHGPHVCIGAALARLEASICIRELITRFQRVELGPGPRDWNYALHVRGLNRLPVRFQR
ncbi:cytochrome P450 [Enhygromyxa salina]|nr:cytochrome P450 [Enhygromyxa salina]